MANGDWMKNGGVGLKKTMLMISSLKWVPTTPLPHLLTQPEWSPLWQVWLNCRVKRPRERRRVI
jgi:hypothetical protein